MNLSAKVLGQTTITRLTQTSAEHVLTIGSDTLTRAELAAVECFNFLAARNLSAALQALGVKNLRDLYDNIPPKDLALPHVGTIAMAVLGAAFEAKRIGGDDPLTTYVRKHQPKVTTFDTMKDRVRREEQALKRDRRRRRKNGAA
jgi:hypothetical protein